MLKADSSSLGVASRIGISGGREIVVLSSRKNGGARWEDLQADINYLRDPSSFDYNFSKEPETVAWLDSLPFGATFWDIGANVGTYSLYAAATKGMKVWSIEPHFASYHALNENIRLSGLETQITALCVAFGAETQVTHLHTPHHEIGGSGSNLGMLPSASSLRDQRVFLQGSLALTLDSFVTLFSAQVPTALKMDVDGLELSILRHGSGLLNDLSLRFLSIEINDAHSRERDEILDLLGEAGFAQKGKFIADKKQLKRSEPASSPNQFFNYHFERL